MYWVSWMLPIKRARLHQGSCKHCNYGKGQNGQHRTGSANTGWEGPFDEISDAMDKLSHFSKERSWSDVKVCHFCKNRGLK